MQSYDAAREAVGELEAGLGTKLSLGYIGNCSSTVDASRPRNYPANYDDRSWSITFVDLGVAKHTTEGRGPWSHRASGTSYPSTRSWTTESFPPVEELKTMVRERFAREPVFRG